MASVTGRKSFVILYH